MTRFTLQNFSKKINYVWQPDVFGFPATLPQILKKNQALTILHRKSSHKTRLINLIITFSAGRAWMAQKF
ncbi:hypothetical protein UL54_16915 [Shigella dysenteriae]|nr:hypothetical protein UL54_16915 [Shigella dysenteriae]